MSQYASAYRLISRCRWALTVQQESHRIVSFKHFSYVITMVSCNKMYLGLNVVSCRYADRYGSVYAGWVSTNDTTFSAQLGNNSPIVLLNIANSPIIIQSDNYRRIVLRNYLRPLQWIFKGNAINHRCVIFSDITWWLKSKLNTSIVRWVKLIDSMTILFSKLLASIYSHIPVIFNL